MVLLFPAFHLQVLVSETMPHPYCAEIIEQSWTVRTFGEAIRRLAVRAHWGKGSVSVSKVITAQLPLIDY